MTTYALKLQVLTPVHIGTGNELRNGFEYTVHGNHTWRLDVDRILEARYDLWAEHRARGRYLPPAKLLREEDFRRRDLFRYVIPGVPKTGGAFAELRECIKDPWDRPYIPGSSLKGALRTALAWAMWDKIGVQINGISDFQYFNKRKRKVEPHPHPAHRFERLLFQPKNRRKYPDQLDPNYDLLRALQVSDPFGPQKPAEGVGVLNAQVVTRDGLKAPIKVEALVNVAFTGTLKIDDTLLRGRAARQLGFGDRASWLSKEGLLEALRAYSEARIEALADRFDFYARHGVPGAEKIANFYRNTLPNVRLSANSVFLALGWGTGWDGKTFWTHLKEDTDLFEAIVRDFHLQRRPKGAPPRKPGDAFPSSRRAVVRNGSIVAPFGWTILTLEEQE